MVKTFLSQLSSISSILFCLLFANSVQAGVLDLRLKVDQIFDVQWNISGGNLNASGFNYIYSSINYATQTTSAARWTAAQTADAGSNNRYIGFFNSTTNPGTYGMAVFNSDGSVYKLINNTGTFRALASGAIFYNGNGMWGTLITTEAGYSLGSSGSWAVTVNYPTSADLEAYVAPAYSSNQTAPPPAPTPVYSSSMTSPQSSRRSSALSGLTGHSATVNIEGNSNDVYIEQTGDSHYITLGIIGGHNSVNIEQTTSVVGVQHYLESSIDGNNNTLDVLQDGASHKSAFVSIDGDYNTASVVQKDSGSHYLQLDLIGDSHSATIVQEGSGSHAATVELTNGGGAWDFNLNQGGTTAKEFSLPHLMSDGSSTSGTCYVAAGCSLTVNQSN